MTDEKRFEYEEYIQKQLKEIDDLDERRFAKELLLESLGRVFAWTEEKYRALEERVQNELDLPWEYFNVFTTVIDRKDYDPINRFWFPAYEEDVKKGAERPCETIYLEADEAACREFLELRTLTGIDEETGRTICFRIEQSSKYQECIKKLHALFVSNHVPWQTVHMGHVERFFDLIPVDESEEAVNIDCVLLGGKWDTFIKRGMVLLWNVQEISVHSREYRIPCIDEVFYEHIFYLPEEQGETDGYLVEIEADILSVRYEGNKIILRTKTEILEDVLLYKLHQGEPEQSPGYQSPVLSNRKKDGLAARYLQQTGNFIQTPMELNRKIEEMAGGYEIKLLGYEITDSAEENFLSGDMNSFNSIRMFSNDNRKILLLRIRRDAQYRNDYLYESQIRYILSQLQMEFLEYRCMGVLE